MIREAILVTVRGVGVLLLTAVEVTALSVWLGIAIDAPPASAGLAVGVGALAAGMLVAGLLSYVTVNGWGRPIPARTVAALALVGTALWVGWLAAVQSADGFAGIVAAGVGLAAALVPRHSVADSAVRGRRLLGSLVQRATIGLAVLEAAGATAWFLVVTGTVPVPAWVAPVPPFSPAAFVGLLVLAAVTFVKHLLAVRHALRPTRQSSDAGWGSSRGTLRE
ncbi:hypothetical protein [Halorussus halobius]|uniref:hypothetical protein n=1 Tax=Halorussus halobius TaxID=1710537 RepID=UPI0010928C12|nr:hypothetical protein [Halorussus halobius]